MTLLKTVPGYDPDVRKNRAEARHVIEKLGYGPENRLKLTVSARNIAIFRDPAVILIDQLKEIYIDGAVDPVETANQFPKGERADDHGEQPIQWLALRRPLAGRLGDIERSGI